MNLIALVGFIGSGKDTVGRRLVEEHGFHDMAFADALKDTCAAIFCWDRDLLDGKNPQSREWRNQVDPWWAKKLEIPQFTPRWALQNIGTETLRAHLNDSLWILNVQRRIEHIREENPKSRIVLTDGRFPNELAMVRSLGGVIARVRRGDEPAWYIDAFMLNQRQGFCNDNRTIQHFPERLRGVHVSEWAWIGYPMDSLIDNNSTLDALFARTDNLVR